MTFDVVKSLHFFWAKMVEIYRQVFSMLKKNPMILFLFLTIGIFDLTALILLFLAPSPPVSYVLAPIIRTFWGGRFLHYPENFLLLPKLFSHAHFLISTVLGVFITGIVIKKIEAETHGEGTSTLSAVHSTINKYFSILIAWLISYAVFTLALKVVMPLLPKNLGVQLVGGFVMGVGIQTLLVFLIPALLILKEGFFRSLWEGIRFGIKNIALTSALIAVPILLVVIVSLMKLYTPLFVRIHPEMVLWVLAGGIVVSLIADILITSSATLLFLKARHEKS